MSSLKLKDADIKDLYLLSLPARLLVAVLLAAAILVFGYAAFFRTQSEELAAQQSRETRLRETYTRKSIQAAGLENLQAELESTRAAFSELLRQLPTDAEIPNLIQELHQAASKNGLRLDSITPLAPVADGPVQKLPYTISLTGTFAQLQHFTRDVGSLSRIITLDTLNIARPTTPGFADGMLTLSATATTYQARARKETADEASAENIEHSEKHTEATD
ncbi:type 4a pilus biogenesis protein PilO [Neisseria animalis]|uniref:Pilus assembly protein PilO n=1 Tax=Neisseria animalis TaxID=492 RepID=A0A5P3MUD4_NEIAN|nr:type 4a pilus biogenesis protein PilO [Neisseria animalis]QEY24269.1 pilus assembly protein PilO [Neisseria animalis]ROW32325.1 pilus assembly protein PilO [Neisseria animalis]VEE06659.1 pilus assembly protein [Neisseria animalis]